MADWPVNGADDWNTKMKANIDVGHDSDGTHKKSQMLTDMEWSPTAYAGEESVKFPNGLIMKTGTVSSGATTGTVTFSTAAGETAFANVIKSVQLTDDNSGSLNDNPSYTAETILKFNWRQAGSGTGFSWTVWGY